MQLNKNWLYWLISASALMLLALGTWWLFLVFKLANKLTKLNHPGLEGNLLSMVKWEGATFLIFLILLMLTLLYVYFLDLRKTKALQAFFSSLTHELKTPLASMRLQTEVLADTVKQLNVEQATGSKIENYSLRLVEDCIKLEDQLDNHLQLSRVERDSPLNLRPIELAAFIKKEMKRLKITPPIELNCSLDSTLILADDYALQTIIRNLVSNTIDHQQDPKKISLTITSQENSIQLEYNDYGKPFEGDVSKLTKLFYKFHSPQGSGIGLYLTSRLMTKMHGKLTITNEKGLIFQLMFEKAKS